MKCKWIVGVLLVLSLILTGCGLNKENNNSAEGTVELEVVEEPTQEEVLEQPKAELIDEPAPVQVVGYPAFEYCMGYCEDLFKEVIVDEEGRQDSVNLNRFCFEQCGCSIR